MKDIMKSTISKYFLYI